MKLSIAFKSAAAAALALGVATAANAAPTTLTTTFNVSATVAASCTISAAPLAFLAYTANGAAVDAQSNISVTCTNTTPYNVGLDQGLATGATVSTRAMQSGGNTLKYKLTSDAGHSTNWGNTVGTDTVIGSGSGSSQSIPVYGEIAASQNAVPGNYSDTITATITY